MEKKIMGPTLRTIEVKNVRRLSPHMQRITFHGAELEDFPENKESAHVKVIIPEQNDFPPRFNYVGKYRRTMRSYTVRHFDAVDKTLDIDFAVNDHVGNITSWANEAKEGDRIVIAGPGGVKHTDFHADWHLFIGDLTALPAIAASLEKLPENAVGEAIIQVPQEGDIADLIKPKGINLKWIVSEFSPQNKLMEGVKNLNWKDGKPAIFLACEASHLREIKAWIKRQPGFNRQKLYDSAYWKQR